MLQSYEVLLECYCCFCCNIYTSNMHCCYMTDRTRSTVHGTRLFRATYPEMVLSVPHCGLLVQHSQTVVYPYQIATLWFIRVTYSHTVVYPCHIACTVCTLRSTCSRQIFQFLTAAGFQHIHQRTSNIYTALYFLF